MFIDVCLSMYLPHIDVVTTQYCSIHPTWRDDDEFLLLNVFVSFLISFPIIHATYSMVYFIWYDVLCHCHSNCHSNDIGNALVLYAL
jgi:hypothetical protein